MKLSFILGLHMILKDICPLSYPGMVGRVLLDPVVEFLLDEQPPLDLVKILSLDEASEFLSRETHGTAEADTLVSMGESHRMIVTQTSCIFGDFRQSRKREIGRVRLILLLPGANTDGI